MTARTEHITAELKRIRAACPDDIAVLMSPLLQALEASTRHAPTVFPREELVTMAHGLSQIATQAGDADLALAIADLQAQIHAITATELGRAATAGPSLARRFPGPLLLGLLAAGALSYGVHVATQARFAPGSLIGWLLSASTTLLAVALTLRLGAFLARRLEPRPLTVVSATAAVLACLFALVSFLIHGPEFARLGTAPGASVPTPAGRSLPPPGQAPAEQPHAVGGAVGRDGAPGIDLWWLGAAAPAPATEVIDGDAVVEAAKPARPDAGPAAAVRQRPAVRPAAQTVGAAERYADLLDRQVRLVDAQGEAHVGLLTGVSKDAVTLRTEVKMFGQPIQAHQQFLHSAIRSVEAR